MDINNATISVVLSGGQIQIGIVADSKDAGGSWELKNFLSGVATTGGKNLKVALYLFDMPEKEKKDPTFPVDCDTCKPEDPNVETTKIDGEDIPSTGRPIEGQPVKGSGGIDEQLTRPDVPPTE